MNFNRNFKDFHTRNILYDKNNDNFSICGLKRFPTTITDIRANQPLILRAFGLKLHMEIVCCHD